MRAIKITTDNLISIAEVPEPTWQGLGQLVGGRFEIVRPWGLYTLSTPYKTSLIMLVNEEGRIKGLDTNATGTLLYNDTPALKGVEPIVGDILMVAEGFANGEPDIVGLYDEQIITVWRALKNKFRFLKEKQCRVCGCTDFEACPGGCYWVQDDLCSECNCIGLFEEIIESEDEDEQ